MDELILHGQRKTSEITDAVASVLKPRVNESQIIEVFRDMVQQRFILRVQPWELKETELEADIKAAKSAAVASPGRAVSKSFLLASSPAQAWDAGVSGAGSPRKRKVGQQSPTADAAALVKRGRNELPPEMKFQLLQAAGDFPEEDAAPSQPSSMPPAQIASHVEGHGGRGGRGGRGGGLPSVPARTSDAGGGFKATADTFTTGSLSDETLWSVGCVSFDQLGEHDACCRLVEEKFGSMRARQVLEAMLKLACAQMGTASTVERTSRPVSVQAVYDDMNSSDETAIERDLLIQFLHMLESDSIGIILKVGFRWRQHSWNHSEY